MKIKKKNKISVIIFTYKRAILLNEVLNRIYKNLKNITEPIYVIYHFDKDHHKSYELLKKKWKSKKIIFIKRKELSLFYCLKYFFLNPLNFIWILRWPIIFKNFNNFKFILEDILKNRVESDFVTMVPDDQIFFSKTFIPNKVFNLLNSSNKNYFYRFFTSKYFKGYNELPSKLKIKNFNENNIKFFEWDCNDKNIANQYLWKYRFTIEGTLYRKQTLVNLIENFIYHNPITLEAIGLWESRFRGFFSKGLSSFNRTAAGYQINSVQKLVYHKNNNFSENKLSKLFLKNYKLIINKKDFQVKHFNVVPKKIYLKKNNKTFKFKSLL
jgi:hypothetical protein